MEKDSLLNLTLYWAIGLHTKKKHQMVFVQNLGIGSNLLYIRTLEKLFMTK